MDEQRKELDTWMFDDIDCPQLQTDVVSADPRSTEPSSEVSITITDDTEDFALSSEDFFYLKFVCLPKYGARGVAPLRTLPVLVICDSPHYFSICI